jgi:hypothetical protein
MLCLGMQGQLARFGTTMGTLGTDGTSRTVFLVKVNLNRRLPSWAGSRFPIAALLASGTSEGFV